MYVLARGMRMPWLGGVFAGLAAITAFGIRNMVQANSISSMLVETAGISTWITGPILGVFTAVGIIGGIKSIARVCEALVPFMAIFYVAGCAILLGMNASALPHTLSLIVTSAFQGTAVVGGFAGAAMRDAVRYGIARGLFSNESGLGSAPIVAAGAQTKNPVRQALVSSTGTFWDTVVVCAVTGLTIVNSGEWMTGAQGAALTKAAFQAIPFVGPRVLAVGLFTFVFSTILGWSYNGEKAVLNHKKTKDRCGSFLGADSDLCELFTRWWKLFPEIEIILSSTWRRHPDMWPHLNERGIHWTGITEDTGLRSVEISNYVQDHRPGKYAILDDIEHGWFPYQRQVLVNTDMDKGLQLQHLRQLTEILK